MIEGLRKFLESIEDWEEIKSIIPAEIRPVKSVQEFNLKVRRRTHTGVNCIAYSRSAIQEVFIVTGDVDKFIKRLEEFQSR